MVPIDGKQCAPFEKVVSVEPSLTSLRRENINQNYGGASRIRKHEVEVWEAVMLAGNLALVSAALFTGAAFYINFAEHPARMGLEDQPLLAQWKPSYKRGLIMQLTLVIVGFLLGSFAWWISGRLPFLFGGLFMLANWPWIIPYRGIMDALSRLRSGGFPVTLPWGEFPEQGDEKDSTTYTRPSVAR